MAVIVPGVVSICPGSLAIYGAPPVFSLVLAIILMIIDFIIPCVTNKKVINIFIM